METMVRMTPPPVRWAQGLLALVAVSHVVVPVVMWARQDELRGGIAAAHPEFGRAEVARSADVAVLSGAVFHVLLLALCVFLVWKLPAARPRIRLLATVSQLLSVVFSVFSWSSSPMFHAVIPVVGALQVLIVVLLWVPGPARAFFAPSAEQQRAGAVGRAGGDLG